MATSDIGRYGSRRSIAGVAHGGGDTLYPLLAPTCAAPNEVCRRAEFSFLAEMMELGVATSDIGRYGSRRSIAGVAHGGGDTLYPLLAPTCAAPNEVCRRRRISF